MVYTLAEVKNGTGFSANTRFMAIEPATEELIQRARDEYQNDDVEVDDDAGISPVPGAGNWVQAWVFVHDEAK